jgi:pantothenate kinase
VFANWIRYFSLLIIGGVEQLPETVSTEKELIARIDDLLSQGDDRVILGIVGKPGAGKSTLVEFLVRNYPGDACAVVPMDGFHLSNLVLKRLNRDGRKGAPDTFDSQGFISLIHRIGEEKDLEIYFPVFDRTIEESISAQGVIKPQTRLIITEGNYLLLDSFGWGPVRSLLDESWYLEIDDRIRMDRLIARHEKFGKEPAMARNWALGSDERNAEQVLGTRFAADVIVALKNPD